MLLKVTRTTLSNALAVAACFAAGSAVAGPAVEAVSWRPDYDAALAEARSQSRLLLVFFRRDDRPLCRAMERETLARPDVVRAVRESFIPTRIDIAARPDLFERLAGGAAGIAVCAVDATGDVVSVQAGYADADATLRFLDAVRSGCGRVKTAQEAAARRLDDAAALHELGEAYLGVENPLRAEEQFRKVIDLGPGDADRTRLLAFSHERIARIRALRGRNVEAREHAAAYRKLDPDDRLGRLDRVRLTEARALAVEMKYAEAIPVLRDLVASRRDGGETDEALLLLGTVLHENGDAAAALAVLERIPREFPRSPGIASANERIAHIENPPPGHVH